MPSRRELANAIRALSMDAVQAANSGHPGAPMGMADIAEVLWNDFLRHNPGDPRWFNRDRFVLSNGHASMLLYSVLHLSGYDLPIEQLKHFRQLGYKTPGHPEYDLSIGVETTTGPLGQGISNAVGMALAEKILAARFNRPDFPVVDHHTYVFLGDGCMMEGISHEACSLAGTLRLGKLIALYDDNGISIDGHVQGWFTDDTPARFRAYGWQVIRDVDGHDPDEIKQAIETARAETGMPTLICCRTIIGHGSPNKQGSEATHGAPLGADEVALVRENIDWPHAPFEVPSEIADAWNGREKGARLQSEWRTLVNAYHSRHPDLAEEFERRVSRDLPADWPRAADAVIAAIAEEAASVATRKASLRCLEGFGPLLPELVGGSADLTGSNLTFWSGSKAVTGKDAGGNYLYFGVREFGMAAILNGLWLHGGVKPYGATFLTFSDYARNAIRMAALMGVPSIFVFTHDSIGLGEDGPTHQPIEHLASLRLIPNLQVWRPCDTVETAQAWRAALESENTPTALVLTRQGLPYQERDENQVAAIARGGYVLRDCDGEPELILIATGSEVGISDQARMKLAASGRRVRLVSMPCTSLFDAQDAAYREKVLPSTVRARVAVEAGVSNCWDRYVGCDGKVIGIDRFGESAPAALLFEHFGFTADHICETAMDLLDDK
jgi:transketolase